MITILTEYAHVGLKQLEIKIIKNALDMFVPKYKDGKDRYDSVPTKTGFNNFKTDLLLLVEYLKSYRFCSLSPPTYKDWGTDVQCKFTRSDIQIIIDMLTSYKQSNALDDKPERELENPQMFRIFRHHVEDLLNDLTAIGKAMESHRLRGIRYA